MTAITRKTLSSRRPAATCSPSTAPSPAAVLRANPRVTVEINGSVVPGATSTAHYNRHADGHDETTGSFVALLSDLAVDDVVTVSVQREAMGVS